MVAIIALVVASAGTATAATKILIKNSAQVKNGALEAADLSAKARASLQGKPGLAGPAGIQGATGAAGAVGATGAKGDRGPSEVLVARGEFLNTQLCPPGGCGQQATLRTIDLPAGSFVVTGSAELAPSTFVANASHSIECHLMRADTGTFQRTHISYRAPQSGVGDQSVEVVWPVTLAAPTTISLDCSVGNVNYGAANARITALQVGSLTEKVV